MFAPPAIVRSPARQAFGRSAVDGGRARRGGQGHAWVDHNIPKSPPY